jgi:hypothetical protein
MFVDLDINFLADIAAILTCIVVVVVWVRFEWSTWRKRKRLENYLRFQKRNATKGDRGQRSILHLMANVGLTEIEILQASFKSRHLKRHAANSESSRLAGDILIEYDESGISN